MADRPAVGVVLPTFEIEEDAGALREFVREVELLGYGHLGCYDHVVGSGRPIARSRGRLARIGAVFHEPLVFLGFVAGISGLGLVTCVLILPQRQTALVAKQAAELAVLSEGRFRLGAGLGWNADEYVALGMPFARRADRFAEQVEVLRELWRAECVQREGRWHTLPGVGIAPRRPVPLWLGGSAPAAVTRAGALADGWISTLPAGEVAWERLATLRAAAADAGRPAAGIGVDAIVSPDQDGVTGQVAQWVDHGATHVTVSTVRAGLEGVQAHLGRLTDIAADLRLGGTIKEQGEHD